LIEDLLRENVEHCKVDLIACNKFGNLICVAVAGSFFFLFFLVRVGAGVEQATNKVATLPLTAQKTLKTLIYVTS